MRVSGSRVLRSFCAAALLLAAFSAPAFAVTMSWSPVGSPGNQADPATGGLYGAVPYFYSIGTYDVTLGQYAAFLNSVATTDPYGVYNSNMLTDFATQGIKQTSLIGGSFSYAVFGNPNMPAFDVTWGDAARFANWMNNGQPHGIGEVAASTEGGSYTLNGHTDDAYLLTVTRNNGATIVLPSASEWHKAAYYDPANATYWAYPTQSNTVPSNIFSPTGTNNANFTDPDGMYYTDPVNLLTPVGAFTDSPGPFGTYDMGGDVNQWNEGNFDPYNSLLRGGSFYNTSGYLSSVALNGAIPSYVFDGLGFRLVSVPEPGCITMFVIGAGALLTWRMGKKRGH